MRRGTRLSEKIEAKPQYILTSAEANFTFPSKFKLDENQVFCSHLNADKVGAVKFCSLHHMAAVRCRGICKNP